MVADQPNNSVLIFGEPTLVREAEKLVASIDLPERSSDIPRTDSTNLNRMITQRALEDLDRESHNIAEKLKRSLKDPGEAEKMRTLLRDVVQKSFTTRQVLRRDELEAFTIRLRDLKQSVELRDRIADRIIDRRIEELLDPSLIWESPDDSTSSVDAPNGVPPGGVRAFLRVDKSESVENVQWFVGQLARIGIAHINISRSGKPILLDITCPDDLPTEERTRLEREIKALEKDAPIRWIVRFMTVSPPKMVPEVIQGVFETLIQVPGPISRTWATVLACRSTTPSHPVKNRSGPNWE